MRGRIVARSGSIEVSFLILKEETGVPRRARRSFLRRFVGAGGKMRNAAALKTPGKGINRENLGFPLDLHMGDFADHADVVNAQRLF